jgi:hypothetical protein
MSSPWRRYRDYRPGEFYVIFADTASGGGDYCAAQFLSKTYLDVPVVYHSSITATEMTPAIQQEAERIFDITKVKPVIAFERNNGGNFEMDRLASLNRMDKYRIYTMKNTDSEGKLVDTGKFGWDTNTATRPKMLQDGKDMIEKHLITIYDHPTVTEMFSFVVVQTNNSWKAQAEVGGHDDLIMALFGVWQLQQTEIPVQSVANIHRMLPKDDLPPGMELGNVTPIARGAFQADSTNPFARKSQDVYKFDPSQLPNDDLGTDVW